jgi:hypothetical protein
MTRIEKKATYCTNKDSWCVDQTNYEPEQKEPNVGTEPLWALATSLVKAIAKERHIF